MREFKMKSLRDIESLVERDRHLRDYLGYNLTERVLIYTGAALGALFPIVATRALIGLSGIRSSNLKEEAIYCGVSIGLNLFPLEKKKYESIVTWGAYVGELIGSLPAIYIKKKREEKEKIFKMASQQKPQQKDYKPSNLTDRVTQKE